LTTGTGVETTGVGVETVVVLPPPEVGLDERVGVPATGREIEAEPECRCDVWVDPTRVATLVPLPARAAIAEAAAAILAPDRGLTTATAARPGEAEAWKPAFGWAVSVCVAGDPMPASFGQPL
jgi:hypothetical protein